MKKLKKTDGGPEVHDLKCWPGAFQAMLDGVKTFEVRRDDRGFADGDWLVLREWRPELLRSKHGLGHYTGRALLRLVTYTLRGPAFGVVPDGVVVMSLAVPPAREPMEARMEADEHE